MESMYQSQTTEELRVLPKPQPSWQSSQGMSYKIVRYAHKTAENIEMNVAHSSTKRHTDGA
jgi:hypothetical protein